MDLKEYVAAAFAVPPLPYRIIQYGNQERGWRILLLVLRTILDEYTIHESCTGHCAHL